MATVPTITLNNGVQIPQLGFGVFQIKPEDTVEATRTALEVGYRHIDTAEMYGNEAEVGEAVRQSGVPREEVFVTSKLNNGFHAREDALRAFDGTMDALKFDYLDLFLVHWPLPGIDVDYVETWKAMEEIYRSGRVKAIGVSNFNAHHLRRLFAETEVRPVVNQIEVHPYFAQNDLRAFNADHEIFTEAWAPIAQGKVLDDPTLIRVGERHGKSPAQAALRWAVQRGDIIFPKSVTRARVEQNFDLFDFALSDDDMREIDGLDREDGRNGPNPDEFNYIPS
ncbi:aldo/keto reductase [Modestobacter marinus]|uniref:2,5-diketo-D-gluconate reductase A n=1 Tax=Modestobacter marinus TaxID=477641 RepID=A0A846LH45_9ACTN|nr:aldo/keto reductase [Modestobacter marinus]NIH66986.1 2,5-diketo-D-gluconate reductase A [Modestobacter marinus]GGL50941.1 oxidoreductase [Modestobacter marinus]